MGQPVPKCATAKQLAGLRFPHVSSTGLMVVQALINANGRLGFAVLCREVPQIIGDVTSVSDGENVCRHLETVMYAADVWAKACPFGSRNRTTSPTRE